MENHPGYIIEVCDGGPWLCLDGTVTPNWEERGVWMDADEALAAWRRSLAEPEPHAQPAA